MRRQLFTGVFWFWWEIEKNLLNWLVASKRELRDWFSNWWIFWISSDWNKFRIGRFFLIQSVFGKVSNLLSGSDVDAVRLIQRVLSITERLASYLDRELFIAGQVLFNSLSSRLTWTMSGTYLASQKNCWWCNLMNWSKNLGMQCQITGLRIAVVGIVPGSCSGTSGCSSECTNE